MSHIFLLFPCNVKEWSPHPTCTILHVPEKRLPPNLALYNKALLPKFPNLHLTVTLFTYQYHKQNKTKPKQNRNKTKSKQNQKQRN